MMNPCEKCQKTKTCLMADFECEPKKQYKAERELYKKLAQLAYDTVLATMQEGEKTHPDNDWMNRPTCYHSLHALMHVSGYGAGDISEDHIAHALTRCAMIKYLEANDK